MPTYSYACRSCGHAFDVRQSFSDDPLLMCPTCGELQLRKVIHPVGISFKGSGFYRTDSKSSAKPSPSEKSSTPTAEKSADASSTSTSSSAGTAAAASSTAS